MYWLSLWVWLLTGHKQEVDLELKVEQSLRYQVTVATSEEALITSIQIK
ncbi:MULTISPECIES: hypothetical protein [unclassified Myroides]